MWPRMRLRPARGVDHPKRARDKERHLSSKSYRVVLTGSAPARNIRGLGASSDETVLDVPAYQVRPTAWPPKIREASGAACRSGCRDSSHHLGDRLVQQ